MSDESTVSESLPLTIKKPTPLGRKLLAITIFSACVAFFPILMVNDDTTGGGGAVFLMCMTIPVGLAMFFIGIISSIKSYWNSLSVSEKEQLVLELRRRGPWLILLTFLTYAILEIFNPI